jgi:hypothetical protein
VGGVRGNRLSLAALLLFVAGLALGPVSESDLFFRIKEGQEILARHGLPGRNLFSFTYPDYPDLDTSWLFEVGAAVLFARGGFPVLVLAKTAVLLGAFAGAFAVCRRRGAGPVAAALALAAAAYAARERFVERPHIFSLAGVVVVMAAVDGVRGARHARAAALALAAAVVLWANLHAGVFLAVGLLALAAAGEALDGWRDGGSLRLRLVPALRLAALAPVAALGTLATPVGVGLYRYLGLHTVLPALHPVDEFRAVTWVSDAPLVLFGAAAAAAGLAVRPRRLVWLLPAAGLALLACGSVRFGADFALVAAPVLAAGLSALGVWLRARAPFLDRTGATAAAALLVGWAAAPRLAAARHGWAALRADVSLGLDEAAVPLDAIRFATDNGLRDRMYNDFEVGSYLAFEGYPRYRVFVDPRLPAYPPELHRLLGRADLGRAEWSDAMRRYGVDSALLAYAGLNRRVAWWDPDEWALVYRAHDARVFVRRLPRFRALIAAREIPATASFTVEEGALTVPLEARPASSPVPDCEWQRRLGDLLFELDGAASARARAAYLRALALPSPRPAAGGPGCLDAGEEARLAAWLGALALGDGDAAGALPLLERALARQAGGADPDLPTRANRAIALEGTGRPGDAAVAWADLAARAAGTALGRKADERRRALSSPSAPPPTGP